MIRRITTQNYNGLYQNVMCTIDTTYDSNIKKKNKHERIITQRVNNIIFFTIIIVI